MKWSQTCIPYILMSQLSAYSDRCFTKPLPNKPSRPKGVFWSPSVSFHSPLQASVLLVGSFPVPPVLLGEQPARGILRGAPQLQLPIRAQPLSAASPLLRRGRLVLCNVRRRQPHQMRELQHRLRADAGGLQTHGGGLYGELPWLWDGPPGFGAGLLTPKSRPQARGIFCSLFFIVFFFLNDARLTESWAALKQ